MVLILMLFLFIMMLFFIVMHCTIGNIVVTKIGILESQAKVEATNIVLVRGIIGMAIIDRLGLETQLQARLFNISSGDSVIHNIDNATNGSI